jgi:hypothetical protein
MVGAYFVDDCGNLVGSLSDDEQTLYPVAIAEGSFDVMLVKANDSATGRVQISFDISALESDATLRELGGLDFSDYTGLLDVNAVISGISTTAFTATLTLDYGKFQDPIPARGFVLADFDVYNVTDAASVTPSSVVESSAGVYVFTIPAQTSTDDLTLNLDKDGFEMAETEFSIP